MEPFLAVLDNSKQVAKHGFVNSVTIRPTSEQANEKTSEQANEQANNKDKTFLQGSTSAQWVKIM